MIPLCFPVQQDAQNPQSLHGFQFVTWRHEGQRVHVQHASQALQS